MEEEVMPKEHVQLCVKVLEVEAYGSAYNLL